MLHILQAFRKIAAEIGREDLANGMDIKLGGRPLFDKRHLSEAFADDMSDLRQAIEDRRNELRDMLDSIDVLSTDFTDLETMAQSMADSFQGGPAGGDDDNASDNEGDHQ